MTEYNSCHFNYCLYDIIRFISSFFFFFLSDVYAILFVISYVFTKFNNRQSDTIGLSNSQTTLKLKCCEYIVQNTNCSGSLNILNFRYCTNKEYCIDTNKLQNTIE